jgi:hypothetical protein
LQLMICHPNFLLNRILYISLLLQLTLAILYDIFSGLKAFDIRQ